MGCPEGTSGGPPRTRVMRSPLRVQPLAQTKHGGDHRTAINLIKIHHVRS